MFVVRSTILPLNRAAFLSQPIVQLRIERDGVIVQNNSVIVKISRSEFMYAIRFGP